MNYEFRVSPSFMRAAKALAKRYPSLKVDLNNLRQELIANPFQGVDLGGGMRKIRMAITSKGKGKSAGARVITINVIISSSNMVIGLIYIYDKSDAANVRAATMRKIVKEMGL
ncbi:MAG: addiction module toxin RelE [Muribaculaceae bacterium]|nr:addiction module toxin RelE [Muribaculaceae bacterium]